MNREGWLFLLVSMLCVFGGGAVEFGLGLPRILKFTVLAVAICLLASLPPLWLRTIAKNVENGAVFPILTLGWRSAVVLCPLVAAAATKWPELKSFSLVMLGCYFPFLVLESALSIIRIRRDSGPSR